MTRPAVSAEVAADRIERVELSLAYLPLKTPISDAKVLTGRQKPLTEVAFVFCEITSRDGGQGFGFGYSKRAGGPGMYAHAKEIASNLIGERSEEHTSELQSRGHLVCRLLLEKKKKLRDRRLA